MIQLQKGTLIGGAVAAILATITVSASASVVGITTDANQDLATLTVLRGVDRTYAAADLASVDVTGFEGSSNDGKARIFLPSSEAAPAAGDRATVLEDLNFERGFNNPSGWSIDFTTPVVNSAGPDVVLFDWGAADSIEVTVNGQTVSYADTVFKTGFGSFSTKIILSNVAVPDLATLEAATTTFANSSTSATSASALAIDLSDFGVPHGAKVVHMSFYDPSPSGIDPLVIVGLPAVHGLVDDFQTIEVGDAVGGANGWTASSGQVVATDPTDAGNRVLRVFDSDTRIYHPILVREGEQATLSFRFYVPDGTTDDVDLAVSLSADASPDTPQDGSTVFRIVSGSLQAHDDSNGDGSGGAFKTLGSYATDTWYDVQLLVDNENDTWQALIRGGSFSDWTLLSAGGDDTFTFRSGAGNLPLVNFYVRTNAGHADDVLYLDDVFVNVPEPATWSLALLGVALVGAFGHRKRERHGRSKA